ncbi:MAG: DUF1287 domain-containing protein [Flavobacteriales bacterium]|jgi:uncharacterized protein|nr:MAG: DUF1287 domain-containing protein [Flavobacteriales bacterium]
MRWITVILLWMLGMPLVVNTASLSLPDAAREQIGVTVGYDPAYRQLAYPGGDVDPSTGVCTDVVIRAFRALGDDLQLRVHEDMRRHFAAYPKLWGLRSTDRNIDHRRVPNLQTFFTRHGHKLAITDRAEDYRPGDIVTWRLSNGLPHIGLVSDRRNREGVPLILHNIGAGTQEQDLLFAFEITGHYRYAPPAS